MPFALTSEMRASLSALTDINSEMGSLQIRLSTGKRVSSAKDSASVYFQAAQFTAKASDMEVVMGNLAIGNKRLDTAQSAVTNIRKLVDTQLNSMQNALSGSVAQRKAVADAYRTMLSQINSYVNDGGMLGGDNILKGTVMKLDMNGDPASAQSVKIDGPVDAAGLSLTSADATGNFANDTELSAAITKMNTALQTLTTADLSLGYQTAVVKARQAFNRTLLDNLNEGASSLTASDATADAATLSAIQTRQSFVLNSMNVSKQYEANLLSLLR